MANFKVGNTCWNDSVDSPSQVYLNLHEHLTYTANMRSDIQNDNEQANDAPLKPKPKVWTNKYVSPMSKTKVSTENPTRGMTTDCVWRNLIRHCKYAYANSPGIRYFKYTEAIFATSGSWCSQINTGSEKYHKNDTSTEKNVVIMIDDWRYIPNILYDFAPYPWPQRVSRAPLRPVWNNKVKPVSPTIS